MILLLVVIATAIITALVIYPAQQTIESRIYERHAND